MNEEFGDEVRADFNKAMDLLEPIINNWPRGTVFLQIPELERLARIAPAVVENAVKLAWTRGKQSHSVMLGGNEKERSGND